MKNRSIIAILILLAVVLFVGCVPSNTPTTNDSDVSTVDNETTADSNATSDATQPTKKPLTSMGTADEQLVKELIAFIYQDKSASTSKLSYKLNQINEGRQPLYVKFSSTKYYFVCAYAYNEYCDLDDPEQCFWVTFKSERLIREYYNGRPLLHAFQINKAEHCWDITDESKTEVALEHYKYFTTRFENGYNIYSARVFDEAFIYSKKDNQYCSVDHPDHEKYDIPCIELDGQGYVLQEVTVKNGEIVEESFKQELGKYYAAFLNMTQEKTQTVDRKEYATVTIDDFMSILSPVPPKGGFFPDKQLVSEINEALTFSFSYSDWCFQGGNSIEFKLDLLVKDDSHALYVKFDPTQYYYLCGYYTHPTKDESIFFLNCYSYIWLAFDDASNIPETYLGCELVAMVQINRAAHCWDIFDENKTPLQQENFRVIGLPAFENGRCICEPVAVDMALLFHNCTGAESSRREYSGIYYYRYKLCDFLCIELDGQAYMLIEQYTETADGSRRDHDLQNELGKYYDAIMPNLDDEEYTLTQENGSVVHYALLKIENIPDLFKN